MNSTLKIMQSIVMQEHLEGSIEDHIAEYQTGHNPSILAATYIKLYRFSLKTLNSFPFISNEDGASLCLEILDKCLLTYNLSLTTKFISWYGPCLTNRFLQEYTKNNTKKAKVIKDALSYDKILEDGYDIPSFETYEQIESELDTYSLLQNVKLTANERAFCKYALEGYSNAEIKRKLDVSYTTIVNIRRSLLKKLV
jgi:DNA-directed RNA polymerase specialized sigma24 family protein